MFAREMPYASVTDAGFRRVCACIALTLGLCNVAGADSIPGSKVACPPGESASGRLDYRDPGDAGQVAHVNANHFSIEVQELVRGQTSFEVLPDIDFILRHIPNHAAALRVLVRYAINNRPQGNFQPVECYFENAIGAYPDDIVVRQIYASYLSRKGRTQAAIDQLQSAIDIHDGSMMELHYNLGLLLVAIGNYDEANRHAAIAYRLGHPLPGLREKLNQLGQWRPAEEAEPEPEPEPEPDPEPARGPE